MKTVRISPQNSIIFIEAADEGEVPTADKPPPIFWNHRCVSVRTLMQYDGETTIGLGHLSEITTSDVASFDGVLDTPKGALRVSVVPGDVVLWDHSGSRRTRVCIWTNDPSEPDEITIGFERA